MRCTVHNIYIMFEKEDTLVLKRYPGPRDPQGHRLMFPTPVKLSALWICHITGSLGAPEGFPMYGIDENPEPQPLLHWYPHIRHFSDK